MSSQTLEVIPPVTEITLEDRARRINEAHVNLGASLNQAGTWAILLGYELTNANASLGERRGGDRSKTANVADLPKKPTFPEWLKTHCPDISLRSAERYMQLSKAARNFLLKSGEDAIRSLLEKSAPSLNDDERETLHANLAKIADGKTYEQLALDFGLKGGKGKKVGKGTGNNGAETKRDKNDPPPGWSPEEWLLYCEADDHERNSIDLLRPIETGIRCELETDSLAHLPTLFRTSLLAAAEALLAKLKAIESPKPTTTKRK